ncbi:hypothetical protein MPSEU_000973100 [Mayamaea pseudoterrestris]|nr:hypothetical protein MPSEU_000973100 [Mayamaea pseudoterrestris]
MKPTPANRPIRDRKTVTHYSDDNPQTFTVKKRRNDHDDDEHHDEHEQTHVSSSSKRRRRPGQLHEKADEHDDEQVKRNHVKTESKARRRRLPGDDAAAVSSFRPSSTSSRSTHLGGAPNKQKSAVAVKKPLSPRKQLQQQHVTATNASTLPKTILQSPPAHVAKDVILPHKTVIHPLLSPAVFLSASDMQRACVGNSHSIGAASNSNSNSSNSEPAAKLLSWNTRLHDQSNSRQPPPPFTCYQEQSSSSSASDNSSSSSSNMNPQYAALGDAVGSVWLIKLGPHRASVIHRCLETDAAQRELRNNVGTSVKTAASAASNTSAAASSSSSSFATSVTRTTVSYPNSVVQVAWHDDFVVVLTQQELQGLRFISAHGVCTCAVQFTLPVHAARSNHQLLVEMNLRQSLLWVTGHGPTPVIEHEKIQHNGNVLVANSLWIVSNQGTCEPLLRKSSDDNQHAIYGNTDRLNAQETPTCLTAIWDTSLSHATAGRVNNDFDISDRTILMVTSLKNSGNDQPMVLSRYDLLEQRSLQHTHIPTVARHVRECFLRAQNDFIFVSTSKGIRVYESSDLVCLHVYGETVSLHGKSVLWRSCAWMLQPQYEATSVRVSKKRKQAWLERTDQLDCQMQHEQSLQVNQDQEFLLMGIPHPYRGPHELQSTLSVWKPGTSVPLTSLSVPTGGVLGVSLLNEANGWRMIYVTAKLGQVFEWRGSLHTDFAGIQYPVGYSVIHDNVEYIEDEDELDQLVVWETTAEQEAEADDIATEGAVEVGSDSNVDAELVEALRISILELDKQKKAAATDGDMNEEKETEDEATGELVSVLLDEGECSLDEVMLPCRPEHKEVDDESSQGPASPVRDSPLRMLKSFEFFASLPQQRAARDAYQEMMEQHAAVSQDMTKDPMNNDSESKFSAAAKPKAKRNRATNIEAMIQSSVDPILRQKMLLRSSMWADGSGSTMKQIEPVNADQFSPCYLGTSMLSADVQQNQSLLAPTNVAMNVHVTSEHASANDGADCRLELNANVAQGNLNIERSPTIISKASEEEREIARELLHLSPSPRHSSMPPRDDPCGTESLNDVVDHGHGHQDEPINPPSLRNVAKDAAEIVVTPSEKGPTDLQQSLSQINPQCPACRGRMVLHQCGKREIPVDYAAIERAERERKEEEEKEKLQRKTEKRRAAEARRRDARKKKKEEEEDLRRREEEARLKYLQNHPCEDSHTEHNGHIYGDHDRGWNSNAITTSPLSSRASAVVADQAIRSPRAEYEHSAYVGRSNAIPSLASLAQQTQIEREYRTPRYGYGYPKPSHGNDYGYSSGHAQDSATEYQAPAAPYSHANALSNSYEQGQDVENQQRDSVSDDNMQATNSTFGLNEPSQSQPTCTSSGDRTLLSFAKSSQEQLQPLERTASVLSDYPTLSINGTELKPSTTLSAFDALSALAGLADFMVAVPTGPDDGCDTASEQKSTFATHGVMDESSLRTDMSTESHPHNFNDATTHAGTSNVDDLASNHFQKASDGPERPGACPEQSANHNAQARIDATASMLEVDAVEDGLVNAVPRLPATNGIASEVMHAPRPTTEDSTGIDSGTHSTLMQVATAASNAL